MVLPVEFMLFVELVAFELVAAIELVAFDEVLLVLLFVFDDDPPVLSEEVPL